MSALELTGLLPEFGELSLPVAERWVAAMLAQASALREHDAWLYPTDPARQSAAEHLHAAWRMWCDDTQSLLDLIAALEENSGAVNGADNLRDALGRALAILQLTPAEASRRRA